MCVLVSTISECICLLLECSLTNQEVEVFNISVMHVHMYYLYVCYSCYVYIIKCLCLSVLYIFFCAFPLLIYCLSFQVVIN